MAIRFTVPGADTYASPVTITEPKQLENWISDLPYANRSGTIEKLVQTLALLNRYPDRIPQRHALTLQLLVPVRDLVNQSIDSEQQQNNDRRATNGRHSEATIEALLTESVFALKHLINDADIYFPKEIDKTSLANVVYEAIELSSIQLMLSYTRYLQVVPTTWREINLLHKFSVDNRLCDISLPKEGANRSIRHAFSRIALITVLDPYRLEFAEIWHAYRYLTAHADLVRVGAWRLVEEAAAKGCFQCQYGSLAKPTRYAQETPSGDARGYLLIETLPLNAQVNADLKRLSAGDTEVLSDYGDNVDKTRFANTLKQMLVAWYVAPSRRHDRFEGHDWLTVIVGIRAIHNHLLQQLVSQTNSEPSETPEEEQYVINSYNSLTTTSEHFETYRWRQLNSSASGSGIEIPIDQSKFIRVGDLLLTNLESSNNTLWRLSVIKRVIHDAKRDRFEAGIQFVPGMLVSASLHAIADPAESIPTLVVKLGEARNDIVFTPANTYQQSCHYRLEPDAEESQNVVAEKRIESTPYFDCFEISVSKN